MLGIIGAMDEEVSGLIDKMQNVSIMSKASMDFYRGVFGNREVVIVKSGIGKVNAGICAQILIDIYGVSAIINTGIAGSLKNEINIGDIVLSSDALQHDVDARGFGYNIGEIPRMETSVFKADDTLIQAAKASCEKVNTDINVYIGRVVSGDQFISDQEKKDFIVKNFSGYCTEMEGAAIAQAAYLNQIPFLIIRAISDKADQSAEMDFKEFERKAIMHSLNLMEDLIAAYPADQPSEE